MKVLVTGAAGMLARATLPALAAAGHETRALARAEADVTAFEPLRDAARAFGPDWIVHLAAFTKVDDCEARPDHAHAVNAIGSRNAAQAAAECGAAILAISTDYVFDGRGSTPYREHDAAAPRSAYGASKWAGEQAIRHVHPRHVIVRTSWLFGAGGPNFVDTILRKAEGGEPLQVVNDQIGSPTFTVDLAQALLRLMARAQFGTYHVTNGGHGSWYDLAAHALRAAGLDTRLEPVTSEAPPRPAPRPAWSVLGNHWYEHVTGAPMPPWRDAVDRHVAARAAAGGART